DLAIHRFTHLIAAGQPIRMHGDGSSERDYTYITDCVGGILAAVEWTARPRPGGLAEPINIGGGARVRLDRLIELIGRTLGREVRIERHGDQPGDVRLTAADLRRAERELGYRPRWGSRKAFGNSSAGTRGFMDVSAEHLVAQARERFQLQDYYGAIHLLEEVVTAGRAFADAHHMLGLSYSLVGQQDQALAQLDRALALNPHYVGALVHRAIVLNELGREAAAD